MKAVALVTGTSSGIGLFTAVHLAQAGFSVVATMRNPTKAEALKAEAATAGVELDGRALDVQDAASVTACVHGVLGDYGRIDLLVNNAGSGLLGRRFHPGHDRRTPRITAMVFTLPPETTRARPVVVADLQVRCSGRPEGRPLHTSASTVRAS